MILKKICLKKETLEEITSIEDGDHSHRVKKTKNGSYLEETTMDEWCFNKPI